MIKNLFIEEASLVDLPFLVEMEKTCFPDFQQSTSRSLKRSILSNHQKVFIGRLKLENKIINTASLIFHCYPKTLRLFSIAVLPEYRKLKIGKELMHYCFEIGKMTGYERISLEVLESNTNLVKWYLQFGFSIKEILKEYYSKDKDGIKMIYQL